MTHRMVVDSLEEIIRRVAEKSGIPRCIRFEDNDCAVAFSGTQEDFALYLTLDVNHTNGWDYLVAGLDDAYHWYEWDFEDRFAFFDAVVDHIATHMNHKFKIVTETVRHRSIRIREYIMDEQGEWQVISDDQTNSRLVGLFISKTEAKEVEKEYHI